MSTIHIIHDVILSPSKNGWERHVKLGLKQYIETLIYCNIKVKEYDDIEEVRKSFEKGQTHELEAVIFTNAWSPLITYVKHYGELYGKRLVFFGFWHTGSYNRKDITFCPHPLKLRWRKKYETTLSQYYEKNYFISEYFRDLFRTYNKCNDQTLEVCSFPFSYIIEEAKKVKYEYKRNNVIFPIEKYDITHKNILADLRRNTSSYGILHPHEFNVMPEDELMKLFSQAKVAFLPYTIANVTTELFQCYVYNTIPLVPECEGLEGIIPKEFMYPREWISTMVNYTKYAHLLQERINSLILEYDKHLETLNSCKELLMNEYCNSNKVFKEIVDYMHKKHWKMK